MAKNLTTGLQRGLRQSIAGGLGTGDLFSIASLDLQFARHKSLDPRVTHTRQSSATYVDGDGVIRTAVTNLLLRSEEFDNAAWSKLGDAAVDANSATSPDGKVTADKLQSNITGSTVAVLRTTTTLSAGAHTLTLYAKQAELKYVMLRINGSTDYRATCDVTTGVFNTFNSPICSTVFLENDWVRISVTAPSLNAGSVSVDIWARSSDSTATGTADSFTAGDGIYLWGAQLEQSSTVGQYVKTTTAINSAPRFDHDPTTGESLGLLVEESRTNYIADSSFQNFGSSVVNNQWFEVSSSFDVTSNQVVSPDGGTNAASYYINTGTGYQATQYRTGLATGTNYVFSVFVKAGAVSDDVTLFLGGDITVNYIRAVFTLTGAGSYSGSVFNGTAVVASNPTIQDVGNGWYRCTLYATFTSPTNVTSLIYPGLFNSQAEGTTTYVWGAQLEAGSFPTSYIPTEGSTVTRAADVASITGTNFSSWYNDSEGTVFADSVASADTEAVLSRLLALSDNTATNRILLYRSGSTQLAQALISSGGSTSASFAEGTWESSTSLKTALGYALDNYCASFGGSVETNDDSGALPVGINQLNIGKIETSSSSLFWNNCISRITYWPTRLSNDTLQTITQ